MQVRRPSYVCSMSPTEAGKPVGEAGGVFKDGMEWGGMTLGRKGWNGGREDVGGWIRW